MFSKKYLKYVDKTANSPQVAIVRVMLIKGKGKMKKKQKNTTIYTVHIPYKKPQPFLSKDKSS